LKIEVFKQDDESQQRGNFCLWYSESGVGKTATLLQTCEDPILLLVAERGQLDLTLKAINRPNLKLKVGYYDGWDDLIQTIYEGYSNTYEKNEGVFTGIKSLIFDGLTHVMNIHLTDEILEENFEATKKKDDDTVKDLTMRVKMSQEGYGTLAKQMIRLMKGFENLTINGIDVHCTARTQENPKWNRSLACAPALSGKEFPRDFKGFFDFIGLLQTRFDGDGKVVYPPFVSMNDDGSYLSKFTGIQPPSGVINVPFDVKKILDVAHGRVKVGKKS
jgi:hypothetical protein